MGQEVIMVSCCHCGNVETQGRKSCFKCGGTLIEVELSGTLIEVELKDTLIEVELKGN